MKAIVKTKPERGFEYLDLPVPQPEKNTILVKVKAAAICGSDLKIDKWDPFVKNVVRTLPLIPGHECAGEVVEVGPGVTDFTVGDRVAAETHVPCGHCWQCLHERRHTCENMELFGHTIPGCFAEYALLPTSAAWKIPSSLSFESGCLLEPMGIPYRAVERAEVEEKAVVVAGCGPIGQFAIAFAKHFGAHPLIALDVNPLRLDIARAMGADHCLNPLQEKSLTETIQNICQQQGGVGAVIEASGSLQAFHEALSYLRVGGKLLVLGQSQEEVSLAVSPQIVLRELELYGFYGRRIWDTWEKTQEILLHGDLDLTPIVTHSFPLWDYQAAFQAATSGQGCKVLLKPEESTP